MAEAPPPKRVDKGKGKQVLQSNGREHSDDENLPWVEKYRPKELDDVVSHQDIIGTSKTVRG